MASPWRYVLWGLALAFEYTAPIRAWRMVRGAPVHPAHIPERFGLLVIIVLGEAVIAVVLGTATESWTAASSAAAFGGFVAAASIWWLYFGFLDASAAVTRNVLAGMTFVYSHYFVTAGIAAFGVGVRLAILSVAPGSRYDDSGWIAARAEATSHLYTISRDGLDASARDLWGLVREQVGLAPAAAQDQHRLVMALAAPARDGGLRRRARRALLAALTGARPLATRRGSCRPGRVRGRAARAALAEDAQNSLGGFGGTLLVGGADSAARRHRPGSVKPS